MAEATQTMKDAQRKKDLAIIKAQNELLAQASERMVGLYGADDPSLAEKLEQINKGIDENLETIKKVHGADMNEVSTAKYNKVSEQGIAEYKKRLEKRGIKDDSFLYEKDLTKAGNSTAKGKTTKKVESVHLDSKPAESKPKAKKVVEETPAPQVEEPVAQPQTQPQEFDFRDIDPRVQYDMLPLPSKGECYAHKKSRIPVAYLTAADENVITSPNLYRDGKLIDVLLGRKILDKTINAEDLVKGDRDAILLWLRATGYGEEMPLRVRDDESGKIFTTTVDLSTIQTKDFKLHGDDNGYFEYTTGTGDVLKFRYLTHKELETLKKKNNKQENVFRRANLHSIYVSLVTEFEADTVLTDEDKDKINNAIELIAEWRDAITVTGDDLYDEINHTITETMIAQTVSVNGNTEEEFIRDYIEHMIAKEARKYRVYMYKNTPEMEFTIQVDRPESLGGGSIETFLDIDEFIFFNITE